MKNKKTLILIIVLAIFSITLLVLNIINQKKLKVISSLPQDNESEIILNQPIKITFNQNIEKNWQINISPQVIFKTNVTANILEIIPEEFYNQNTQYQVTLTNQKYKNFTYTLSFKTIKIVQPTENNPYTFEDTQKYYKEWDEEVKKEQPLLEYMPYKTDTYLIFYTAPLTLSVITKVDSPEIRQEINDWIASKGIDPKTHKINWEIWEKNEDILF